SIRTEGNVIDRACGSRGSIAAEYRLPVPEVGDGLARLHVPQVRDAIVATGSHEAAVRAERDGPYDVRVGDERHADCLPLLQIPEGDPVAVVADGEKVSVRTQRQRIGARR